MTLDTQGRRKPFTKMIRVRCTPEFFAGLERAAGLAGDGSVSEFLRRIATERAKRLGVVVRP